MQYEAPSAHLPPVHSREQHSVLALQGLPAVLQLPATAGPHIPLVHWPLQHSPAPPHACPSALQAAAHLPPAQDRLQQSVPTLQLVPSGLQTAMDDLQVMVVGSQMPEQQPMLVTQVAPDGRHCDPGEPPVPPVA